MSPPVDSINICFEFNKPWSFGSHALLSREDLVFVTRLLECRKCRLRQVYHSLAASELRGHASDNDLWRPAGPRRHFHQLTRLVKAILVAFKRQQSLCYLGSRGFSAMPGNVEPCSSRLRRWVCRNHGTDVFRYMFYAADDCIYGLHIRGVHSSRPAKWVGYVFPKGQTHFYSLGLTDYEKADTEKVDFSAFASCSTIPQPSLTFATPSSGLMLLLGTRELERRIESKQPEKYIEDANRRWNMGYKDLKPSRKVATSRKSVHFPDFSPVTGVRKLIKYETAMRCLRRDRTWELCYLDRLRSKEKGEEIRDDDEDVDDEPKSPDGCLSEPTASTLIQTEGIDVRHETSGNHERKSLSLSYQSETDTSGVSFLKVSPRRRRNSNRFRSAKSYPGSPVKLRDFSEGNGREAPSMSIFNDISSFLRESYLSPQDKSTSCPSIVEEFCVSKLSLSL